MTSHHEGLWEKVIVKDVPFMPDKDKWIQAPKGSSMCRLFAVPRTDPWAQKMKRQFTLRPSKLPAHIRVAPTEFFMEDQYFFYFPRFAWLRYRMVPPIDNRFRGTPVPRVRYVNAMGAFPFQVAVVEKMMRAANSLGGALGVVPCGMGKTEIISMLIASCECEFILVVVPKCNIQQQDIDKIGARCPDKTVGGYDGKRKEMDKQVVVITYQSLCKLGHEKVAHFSCVIVDEVHMAPAKTMWEGISMTRPRKMFGVTATLYRSDGFEDIITDMIGPHVVQAWRPWIPARVRCLQFKITEPTSNDFSAMPYVEALTELTGIRSRNDAILRVTFAQIAAIKRRNPKGRFIAMVDRRKHAIELCRAAGGSISDAVTQKQLKQDAKMKKPPPEVLLPAAG